MKVVFATETLAAGINMPARTTVISALSRRRDTSFSLLHHNELLQMAGPFPPPLSCTHTASDLICSLSRARQCYRSIRLDAEVVVLDLQGNGGLRGVMGFRAGGAAGV